VSAPSTRRVLRISAARRTWGPALRYHRAAGRKTNHLPEHVDCLSLIFRIAAGQQLLQCRADRLANPVRCVGFSNADQPSHQIGKQPEGYALSIGETAPTQQPDIG
jgi:hypothetical protein